MKEFEKAKTSSEPIKEIFQQTPIFVWKSKDIESVIAKCPNAAAALLEAPHKVSDDKANESYILKILRHNKGKWNKILKDNIKETIKVYIPLPNSNLLDIIKRERGVSRILYIPWN